MSAASQAKQGILVLRYLFTETPVLGAMGTFGLFVLTLSAARPIAIRLPLLTALACGLTIAGVGGRDFSYYTIPLIPVLALGAALLPASTCGLLRWGLCGIFTIPIFFSLISLAQLRRDVADYRGDGALETAEFLNRNLGPDDSLYVWSYRPDLYVYTGRLAPFPMMNRIMIHPDFPNQDRAVAAKHVDPIYEQEFIERFKSAPPTYLVRFTREPNEISVSNADDFVQNEITNSYTSVFSIQREDLSTRRCRFEVFGRLKN